MKNEYTQNVCPYDIGQLMTARYVLRWAIENCKLIPDNNILINNIFESLDNAILDEVSREVKRVRLKDYSTLELEIELECRKEE